MATIKKNDPPPTPPPTYTLTLTFEEALSLGRLFHAGLGFDVIQKLNLSEVHTCLKQYVLCGASPDVKFEGYLKLERFQDTSGNDDSPQPAEGAGVDNSPPQPRTCGRSY